MIRVAILGSTGSIGRAACQVAGFHRDRMKVVALAARRGYQALAAQARELKPDLVGIFEEDLAPLLRRELSDHPAIEVCCGPEGLSRCIAETGCDRVLLALVGAAGIEPAARALSEKKILCLANKEVLVAAGEIIMALSRKQRVPILPVDSEHSAIFQCLRREPKRHVRRLVLTASGGAFRTLPAGEFKDITPERALNHPTWRMGPKITIDSATMMNKGFELIEAHHLFGGRGIALDVLVHPESVVHSMVEFVDGSLLAQLGVPDMRLPIQYALAYPDRIPSPGMPPLDLARLGTLHFETADETRFPCLRLARQALAAGGALPCVLNAANEVAVAAFLESRLGFPGIPALIEACLERANCPGKPRLEDILATDRATRLFARDWIESRGGKT